MKSERDGRWLACGGIVETHGGEDGKQMKNLAKSYHEYVGDPQDGGIAPFFTKLGERDVITLLSPWSG